MRNKKQWRGENKTKREKERDIEKEMQSGEGAVRGIERENAGEKSR